MIKRISTITVIFLLLLCNSIKVKSQEQENAEPIWNPEDAVTPTILQNTRSFREKLLADPYRPAYHFCVPEDMGRPGDPNGAYYHNGVYHLMYLYRRAGSDFSWGHISSKDLIHWRHHPDAIGPGINEEGCFSGGAFVDDDNSVILSYWMIRGAKGIGLARSYDSEKWYKFDKNPVIKSTEWGITETVDEEGNSLIYGSADPSNIWKKDGKYYMLTGNLLVLRKYGEGPNSDTKYQGDWLDLFVSDDMVKWKYMHRFYESKREWTEVTEDNMCPSFLPLPTSPDGGEISDKHLLLFISHNKGCQYYIGDYKDDKFFPESHGRMTWVDNHYFAPEALVDDEGRQIMWTWVRDGRPREKQTEDGWSGTYGLPRSLWLREDNTLGIEPIKELQQLRMNEKSKSNITVNSGEELPMKEFSYELMEVEVTFLPNKAKQYGIKVCRSGDGREETVIYYDSEDKKLKLDTRKSGLGFGTKTIEAAPLELKDNEPLVLRVFVDRSIVEVFANGKQAIGRMIYPTLGGNGISLFSNEGKVSVKSIKTWEMFPSNPY